MRQHYDTDALDASTLLAITFCLFAPTDDLARKTADAMPDELTEDTFVLRYRTDESDDGMSSMQWTSGCPRRTFRARTTG